MNRRTFLSTPAAMAVPSQGHSRGGYILMGRWLVDLPLKRVGAATLVLDNAAHEGPVFKCPVGIPERGDAVILYCNWTTCENRGNYGHRPILKREFRVKPAMRGVGLNTLHSGDTTLSLPWRRAEVDRERTMFIFAVDPARGPSAACPSCGRRVPASLAAGHCPPGLRAAVNEFIDSDITRYLLSDDAYTDLPRPAR